MRWNVFLPRPRPGIRPEATTKSTSSSLTDHGVPSKARPAGSRSSLRRLLQRLGPTWESSPLRRSIQVASLLVFLALFFYVCWPYDARPASASSGWIPVDVDRATGAALLARDAETRAPGPLPLRVFVADESQTDADRRQLGWYRTEPTATGDLKLIPEQPPSSEQLEERLFSPGPWTLTESVPGSWPSHYADRFARKERLPAESLLVLDPLVSLSTALAARTWVGSLAAAAAILLFCAIFPRGFCGYLCPLGTLIDLFDSLVSRRIARFRVAGDGWWVQIRYYLLLATVVAALFGVLLSGAFAPIPVLTRALMFTAAPLQIGVFRGFHQVPPWHTGHWLSLLLFVALLSLGMLQPRFWCKYVCPSGALFSLGNVFRLNERKVERACVQCGKCVDVCPFDAIQPDFTTRGTDCTFCQTCGGVCPTRAITFVARWRNVDRKPADDPPTGASSCRRRDFLSLAAGATVAGTGATIAAGVAKAYGGRLGTPSAVLPVRPPGSVPERQFLQLCIRCGECFKVCPNNVLQPLGWQQGWEGLWTPFVNADWAGCESSCNTCGLVCPTGAIRPLSLDEKRHCRLGLAEVDPTTCLPHAVGEACDLCVRECHAAGYDAIEFIQAGTAMDTAGRPIEGSGIRAPVVLAAKCVGCGLCQTRCHAINVKQKGLLRASAIVIAAGEGRDDRLTSGSYRALRNAENERLRQSQEPDDRSYLPEFLQ